MNHYAQQIALVLAAVAIIVSVVTGWGLAINSQLVDLRQEVHTLERDVHEILVSRSAR